MNKNKAKKEVNNFLKNKVNFTSLPKMLFLVHGDRIFPHNYKEILNNRWLINYITKRAILATICIIALGCILQNTTEFIPYTIGEVIFFSVGIGMISWFAVTLGGYTVAKNFFINREMKKFLAYVKYLQNIKEFNHILGLYLHAVIVKFERKNTITDLDVSRLFEFGKHLGQAPYEVLAREEYRGVVKALWKVLIIAHKDKKFSDIMFTKNVDNVEVRESLAGYLKDFLKTWKEHKEFVCNEIGYSEGYLLLLEDIRGHIKEKAKKTEVEMSELS
jgi:hypothetical protein